MSVSVSRTGDSPFMGASSAGAERMATGRAGDVRPVSGARPGPVRTRGHRARGARCRSFRQHFPAEPTWAALRRATPWAGWLGRGHKPAAADLLVRGRAAAAGGRGEGGGEAGGAVGSAEREQFLV